MQPSQPVKEVKPVVSVPKSQSAFSQEAQPKNNGASGLNTMLSAIKSSGRPTAGGKAPFAK